MTTGTRVTVLHRDLRWNEEPGVIVAQHPPRGTASSYVVRVAGREIICKPEQLTREES